MPGGPGTGSVDLRSIFGSILNIVKSRANAVCTAPCDGAILKMHYRWTFFVLIGSFFTVWYQWYNRDVITCVSHFNAETQVRLDYINICLSYPYVEEQTEDPEQPRKRYLLFYRWVQWSFLVMAGIYYIPRKISKNMENPKCKKLIEELAANASRYDSAEQVLVDKVTMYMSMNIRTHNGLFYKYFALNIIALIVDLFAMHYFNFLLQGRFLRYGFDAYPFDRDPEKFTDYMSQMFPPFALCTLDKDNQLVNKRDETFGCHLTIMELYEKVFLFLWVWLIILITMTSMYIVALMFALVPKVREFWLRIAKPVNAVEKANIVIAKVNQNCRIGDVYFLYRLKGHMSHARFYELLHRLGDQKLNPKNRPEYQALVDPKTVNKPNQMSHIPQTTILPHSPGQQSEARNRKPQTHAVQPPVNPDYLNHQVYNPENLQRHGQLGDSAQRAPLLGKGANVNTSILIE